MKTPVNKPPRSKIVSVIKDDRDKRFLLKESIKGKWKFWVVEHNSDKLSRQLEKVNTIAERIAMTDKLIHSTSMDNYLLSTGSTKTSANNGRIENCHTRLTRQLRLERK